MGTISDYLYLVKGTSTNLNGVLRATRGRIVDNPVDTNSQDSLLSRRSIGVLVSSLMANNVPLIIGEYTGFNTSGDMMTSIDDANDIEVTSLCMSSVNTQNIPEDEAGMIFSIVNSSDSIHQFLFSSNSSAIYRRYYNGAEWGEWEEIFQM